jgi:hypothetical protein
VLGTCECGDMWVLGTCGCRGPVGVGDMWVSGTCGCGGHLCVGDLFSGGLMCLIRHRGGWSRKWQFSLTLCNENVLT